MQRYPLSYQLWLAPEALAKFGETLRHRLPEGAEFKSIVSGGTTNHLQGPAVPVLTARDLEHSNYRTVLLQAVKDALPGRPVVFGILEDKDVLLEAINTWRVYRMVPQQAPLETFLSAIEKAHEALHLEYALNQAVQEYRWQRRRLQFAMEQISGQRAESLHAGRLATICRIAEALLSQVDGNLQKAELLAKELHLNSGLAPAQRSLVDYLCLLSLDGMQATRTTLVDLSQFNPISTPIRFMERVELATLLGKIVDFCRYDSWMGTRKLLLNVHDPMAVQVDQHRLFHLLIELLRAMLRAVNDGQIIEVHLRRGTDEALVEIWDFSNCPDQQQWQRFIPFWGQHGALDAGLGLHPNKVIIESFHGPSLIPQLNRQGNCVRVRLGICP
jgi:hypothetical protein